MMTCLDGLTLKPWRMFCHYFKTLLFVETALSTGNGAFCMSKNTAAKTQHNELKVKFSASLRSHCAASQLLIAPRHFGHGFAPAHKCAQVAKPRPTTALNAPNIQQKVLVSSAENPSPLRASLRPKPQALHSVKIKGYLLYLAYAKHARYNKYTFILLGFLFRRLRRCRSHAPEFPPLEPVASS